MVLMMDTQEVFRQIRGTENVCGRIRVIRAAEVLAISTTDCKESCDILYIRFMSTLLPFHTQLGNAWKLFLHRWGSAVAFQALMIIPTVLMLPLVAEYIAAVSNGVDPTLVFQLTSYGPQFIIGFILLLLLGIFTASGMGILFATQEKISFWKAAVAAAGRFLPVVYTTLLASIVVAIAFLPAMALDYWYGMVVQSGLPDGDIGVVALNIVVVIALIALLIPAVILAIWVMYAPLATALKAAPAGFTSLMFSKHLVHGHFLQVFWKMLGAVILFQIITASVSSLPYAAYLVPFALNIIIVAFFVELYKELQQEKA